MTPEVSSGLPVPSLLDGILGWAFCHHMRLAVFQVLQLGMWDGFEITLELE